jgi:DNA polymerase III alpha subunit
MSQEEKNQEIFAIRFGLGAIKAVGFGAMENAIKEREENGKFSDIYDFTERLDPKAINKKSIEALAKSGALESLTKNRRQVAESFDVLSSYAAEKSEEATSNQMSLFGGIIDSNSKPELKKTPDWSKVERLQKEFEAFGFFLNEHPLDDNVSELKKRGVIFSDKIERDELSDNNLVKMAGIIAASKHRSGPRGRFAYMTISDPFGIFEATIFDESLITAARDILIDGSAVVLECLIRKDDGGVRILVREVKKLDDFIKNTKAQEQDFEDIKKQPERNRNYNREGSKQQFEKKNQNSFESSYSRPDSSKSFIAPKINSEIAVKEVKKIFSKIEIILKDREPIFAIKSLLSQGLAPINCEKFTTVFFSVISDKKVSKIELPKKYFLDEAQVSRLRAIEKIIDVETTL